MRAAYVATRVDVRGVWIAFTIRPVTVQEARTETPPAEAFQLREATVALIEGDSGPIQPDGTVLIHVIRPTVGRGRGSHLYEADMLRANTSKFVGWKMYVNHLSPEARRAAGGLPRDVRDLGGRIVEAWWDDNVPPDDRYGQGAVVARAKPTPFIRDLIENDPEIVEASISATATGVRRGTKNGKQVWIVEGISDRGSVDWVTEAGAGGRVVSLLEAAMETHSAETTLSSLDDEEFLTHLRAERPHLAEALSARAAGSVTQEEDMGEIKPEMLAEALQSDEIAAIIDARVEARVAAVLDEKLPDAAKPLVEAALATERDLIRAEANADATRQISLRDLRDEAHGLIEAAGRNWPEIFVSDAKSKFDLTESGPSTGLDVIDDVDGEGQVVKTARQVLQEAVQTEITRQGALLAAAHPTRVVGQGPISSAERPEDAKPADGTYHGTVLQEAGIDANSAWDAV